VAKTSFLNSVIQKGAESFFWKVVKIHGLGRHFSIVSASDGQKNPMATFEVFVRMFVFCVTVYAAAGSLFAVMFVFCGVQQVDSEA
jgi:hypothetical protein